MTSGFLFLILFSDRHAQVFAARSALIDRGGAGLCDHGGVRAGVRSADGERSADGGGLPVLQHGLRVGVDHDGFRVLVVAFVEGGACGGGVRHGVGRSVRVAHPPVSFDLGIVEATCSYALIIVMLYHRGGRQLDAIAREASPASLELSNPESFLRPAHALFLCVGLFSVATGYGLTLNEVSHAPISVDVSAVVLAGVAAWMLLSRSESKEDMLFSFAMLLVVAGFIIAPFTFLTDLPSANALLRIGVRSFDMLVWLVVLAVGRQNLLALLPTFALVRFMSAVGTDVGAIAGHTTNDIVGTNDDAAMLIAEVVLFAFVAFLWLGFRKFSFADTIRGVVNVGEREAGCGWGCVLPTAVGEVRFGGAAGETVRQRQHRGAGALSWVRSTA